MLKTCVLVDPRFPGGTASAVAREMPALAAMEGLALSVSWLRTRMFRHDTVNRKLELAACELGIAPGWAETVRAHTVILHNPAALKFDAEPPARIVCDRLLVICHENFLRPDGEEGFAVAHCLSLLRRSGLIRSCVLVPISPWNRRTVLDWCARNPEEARFWAIADRDWFNICDFTLCDPEMPTADRRGRMSRPGFEKFPDRETMEVLFPAHAACNRILGGDNLLLDDDLPAHWEVLPFGSLAPEHFLQGIDFFVYFTNPRWRESFGRVIAEAIAAGKTVITDPETATIFGSHVFGCRPDEVEAAIASCLADPAATRRRCRAAQADLATFSAERFRDTAGHLLFQTDFPTTLLPRPLLSLLESSHDPL